MTKSKPNKSTLSKRQQLLDQWDFEWPIIDVIIGGKSSIDLTNLAIDDNDQAHSFLKTYGYNLKNPSEKKKVHAIFIEALNFISTTLMPEEWGKGLVPKPELITPFDLPKLLINASSPKKSRNQLWSCAILRVMHTIVHIDELERFRFLDQAREQIIGRFQDAITRDKHNRLWFGAKNNKIEIERVEWKPAKVRKSMILKLLHKPGNVSDTIYDILGVRIVTKSKGDAMQVVKNLRQLDIISFPNTNPSRARNTLVNLDEFKSHVERFTQLLQNNYVTEDHFQKMISRFDADHSNAKRENPHSADSFHSIQITCRQRVTIENPILSWIHKMSQYQYQDKTREDQSQRLLNHLHQFYADQMEYREHSLFFPFEVQIIDTQTSHEIQHGNASHDQYKSSQVRTARRRVLCGLLTRFRNSQARKQAEA